MLYNFIYTDGTYMSFELTEEDLKSLDLRLARTGGFMRTEAGCFISLYKLRFVTPLIVQEKQEDAIPSEYAESAWLYRQQHIKQEDGELENVDE